MAVHWQLSGTGEPWRFRFLEIKVDVRSLVSGNPRQKGPTEIRTRDLLITSEAL